jgi:hypothetical protein
MRIDERLRERRRLRHVEVVEEVVQVPDQRRWEGVKAGDKWLVAAGEGTRKGSESTMRRRWLELAATRSSDPEGGACDPCAGRRRRAGDVAVRRGVRLLWPVRRTFYRCAHHLRWELRD